MKSHSKSILSLAVAAALGSVSVQAAEEDGEETGNNLSTPVIWSDGITKALRVHNDDPTATLLTGASVECVDIPGETCFVQQDPNNIWQAESWNATTDTTSYGNASAAIIDGLQVDQVDWGDNLEARNWNVNSPVRVETVLWQTLGGGGNHSLPSLAAYEMSYISGQGQDEVWGTTGNTVEATESTVYSNCARLTIQKVAELGGAVPTLQWDHSNSQWRDVPVYFSGAVWEAGDGPGFYSSEINVSGKIIYGFNWNVGTYGDGTGIYRLTFSLDGTSPAGQQCGTTALNTRLDNASIYVSEEVVEGEEAEPEEGGAPGGGTAVVDGQNNLSYIDVTIEAASGSGGGGGGGGGGGPGPRVSDEHISISGASGNSSVYIVSDLLTATWDNTATGDDNTDVTGVTVDFSAFGGDAAVAATETGGIWSASYEISGSSVSGSNLNVSVTATDALGSVTGPDSSNASVDALLPTIESVTSSTEDGTYDAGDMISVLVNFSENVTVTGTPGLRMETGASDRLASYSSGSGSDTLSFDYTVQTGDNSGDLDYASINALELGGGTIIDTAGNGANRLLPTPGSAGSLGASKTLVVAAGPSTPPSGGGGGSGGSTISQPTINTGTLVNPVITATGSVEGGFLSGTVSSAGLIRNAGLKAGTVVQGGRLAGTITGDPAGPARINATITAGTVLSNVVIGAGSEIDPDAIIGSNVSFETLANVPPGMDLSVAQGGSPWLHGAAVVALDLERSLVDSGVEQQSLLEAISALDQFDNAEVAATEDTGEFTVHSDGSRSRLVPVALHRAADGTQPGTSVNDNGLYRIITDSGLELTSLPVIDDVDSLRREAEQASPPLALDFDAYGGIVASRGQTDAWISRGDVVAVAVDAGNSTGKVIRPLESPAGVWGYSLVYEADDGTLYRQDVSPAPADWTTLKSTLQSVSGVSGVQLDAEGFVTLNLDGETFRGRPGYEVVRNGDAESNDGSVTFDPVGDLNGDGRDDFHMHFPNGDTQILYILP